MYMCTIALAVTLTDIQQSVEQSPVEADAKRSVVVFEEVEDELPEEPEPYFTVTEYDRDLLARVVFFEGNTESIECQRGIVSVIFNRVSDGRFGDSIEEVVYAPNQFETASYLYSNDPTETNYEAVDYVIQNGPVFPENVLYFRANYYFSWAESYTNIDNTYFSCG